MTEQEEALIDAAVGETVEQGYGAITVEAIVARAGISRSAFDARFAGKQAVVEFAYETLFELFLDRLRRTAGPQPSWPLKVKVGIGVTLDMAAASPVEATFLAFDPLVTDEALVRQRFEARERLARLLVGGRTETEYGPQLPGIAEQALVAGAAWVISSQLIAGEAQHLPSLAPQLVELVLTPYLGREAAAEIARRPRLRVEDG
jgi:AcrR family transcriptional regulator